MVAGPRCLSTCARFRSFCRSSRISSVPRLGFGCVAASSAQHLVRVAIVVMIILVMMVLLRCVYFTCLVVEDRIQVLLRTLAPSVHACIFGPSAVSRAAPAHHAVSFRRRGRRFSSP